MKARKRFTETQLKDIRTRRNNGESQRAIARDYGCSDNHLSRVLRDGNKATAKIKKQDHHIIQERLAAGETLREIAASCGVSPDTIKRIGNLLPPPPSSKVTTTCLKCGCSFQTVLAGRIPKRRICPTCREANQMYCGALI